MAPIVTKQVNTLALDITLPLLAAQWMQVMNFNDPVFPLRRKKKKEERKNFQTLIFVCKAKESARKE